MTNFEKIKQMNIDDILRLSKYNPGITTRKKCIYCISERKTKCGKVKYYKESAKIIFEIEVDLYD
jgi:hypothetical protein